MNKPGRKDGVGRLLLMIVVVGLGAIVAVSLVKRQAPTPEPAAAVPGGDAEAAANDVEAEVSPMHKLEGRWLRPDGGYILELSGAGPDGKIDAGYLNPRPIHVSRTETSKEGERLKLLVELQDTGYPGCVYTLHYDAEEDVLTGTYYQAAMGETFAVQFVRQ